MNKIEYQQRKMLMNLMIFIVTHCIFVSFPGISGCPYKECSCSGSYIYCGSSGLTSLPVANNEPGSSYDTLRLDNNQITDVPDGSLPGGLYEISFAHNPITTIGNNAFNGSSNTLHELSFSDALFTKMPDALLSLNVLRHFTIYDMHIDDWNMNVMKHLCQSLDSFYLSIYDLKVWPDWIQYCSHLTEISLVNSSISTIPDGAFDAMAGGIVTLALQYNNLASIPKAFLNLTALENVYLEDNKITNIEWLPPGIKLKSLSLPTNSMFNASHLSDILRRYANTITEIEIVDNQLTAVPDLSFLANVGSFNFSYNKISDPNSGSLPAQTYDIDLSHNLLPSIPRFLLTLTSESLTDLHLSFNAITEIIGTDFPLWAKKADIDYNHITEIKDSSFPPNSSLTHLNLSYNPISIVSTFAFSSLSLLQELYLRGTNLTRVPLALGNLGRIYVVDLSDSANLVCTCSEKDLGSFFQSFYEMSVLGNCGQTSIYTFFTTLSPTCPNGTVTSNII